MFCNDPNLYGPIHKDVVPPFLGAFEPWKALPRFVTPFAQFGTDPNLYGLTYRDVVPQTGPFFGGFEPWKALPRFVPPYAQFGIPQYNQLPYNQLPYNQLGTLPQTQFPRTPTYFDASVMPFPPYMQAAIPPYIQPFNQPFNVIPPMFHPYRPYTF